VSVFTDADEGEIDRFLCECLADVARDRARILFSVQQMMAADSGFGDESLQEVTTEARAMAYRQPYIFVEMEQLDS
jgi:hypothetical protein